MSKVKKNIRLCAISTDFSELGGYRAQFVGEQDVKDARDFTAEVIDELGIVADGAVLATGFERFMTAVLSHAASTGQPVRLDGVFRVGPTIRGLYKDPGAPVPLRNVRLGITPLKAMKPEVEIVLHNVVEGETLYLDVISDAGAGAKIGYVSGSADVQINGRNCSIDPEAEDEGVWYQTVGEGGAEGEMIRLEDVTSDVKTVWFSFPSGALEGAKSVKITVKSRCGNPEAGVQAKSITAKVG